MRFDLGDYESATGLYGQTLFKNRSYRYLSLIEGIYK